MRLSGIITQLRAETTSFGARIAGAAELAAIEDDARLALPAAYVIPLEEEAGRNTSQTSIRQELFERFGVVLAVGNTADPRGQGAYDAIHDLRTEIWAAILNWAPGAEHGVIEYDGAEFLEMSRAVFLYQLAFVMPAQITVDDGHMPTYDDLEKVRIDVDMIAPAYDPNTAPDGGPDGRIEHVAEVDLPTE